MACAPAWFKTITTRCQPQAIISSQSVARMIHIVVLQSPHSAKAPLPTRQAVRKQRPPVKAPLSMIMPAPQRCPAATGITLAITTPEQRIVVTIVWPAFKRAQASATTHTLAPRNVLPAQDGLFECAQDAATLLLRPFPSPGANTPTGCPPADSDCLWVNPSHCTYPP